MIATDAPPARATIAVLLVGAGDETSATHESVRGALGRPCESMSDVEVVEAGAPAAAVGEAQRRRFAAIIFDAPSTAALEAAMAAAQACSPAQEGSPLLMVVTSRSKEAAQLAGERALVMDVLDASLAPVLAVLKVEWLVTIGRERLRLMARVEGARRAAEDHVATVAHDLRNPLNVVLLSTHRIEGAMDEAAPGATVRKSTATIARAVARMSRLVADLLDVARLDAGQSLPLEWVDVDIAEQVRQAAEAIEPLAAARRVHLQVLRSEPIRTWCDPERVQQVLANLLGNALKFTREGGTVSLHCRQDVGEPRSVVVSVSDTGVGIPSDKLSQIFTAYWQRDFARKRGTGLGLAIATAIARAHGGSLEVESTEGVGSTFVMRLPHRTHAEVHPPEMP